jgi:MFS family permease
VSCPPVSLEFDFILTASSAFGLTCYTAGITAVIKQFDVSMTRAILGFSLFLFGIVFAPIITPHLSERLGRSTVYLTTFPIFALFILGAGLSQNFGTLAVCRFFAGFFGGPSLVLIEGTFADVWSADLTVSYYSVLSLASFLGAGTGIVLRAYAPMTK